MPRHGSGITERTTKTGAKRWHVVVDVPTRDGETRKQVKRSFKSKAEAEAFREETRTDNRRGRYVRPERLTVKQLVDSFIADKELDERVREKTMEGYRGSAKRVVDELGAREAQSLTRLDVSRFVKKCAAEGLSRRTVTGYLWILSSALQVAVDNEQLVRNVAATVKALGKPPRARRALTDAEWEKFVRAISNDDAAGAWWLTLMGLRRSELLGLRWSDIDLKERTVKIERGRVLVGGSKTVEGPPKTAAGARTIVVPKVVSEALATMRAKQMRRHGLAHVRDGYLVVDEKGRAMRPERWSDSFKALAEKAGVSGVSLHSARHTAVTRMRAAGALDHAVAQFVGHDEVVMRRTYTHVDFAGITNAGELLVSGRPDVTTDVTTGSD